MTTEASSFKKIVTGMLTTATVFGTAQSLYGLESIDPSLLVAMKQSSSYYSQMNDNILSAIQLDIINAGFSVSYSDNDNIVDEHFGEMKLVNYYVALNDKTIDEMVSINMDIIDKYSLFSKEKIVLMLYAA